MNKNFELKNITYISVLKYVSNNLSGENIAIGLLAVSDKKRFLKISKSKLKLIKSLNADASKLIEFSLNQLNKIFEDDLKNSDQQKLINQNILSIEYLNRLANYNNGIVQFSSPQTFNMIFEEDDFENFFQKYISIEPEVSPKKILPNSSLKVELQNNFYNPLRNKIDVDYTLKKKSLPSLLFDFHLDGLGVNGAVYAVKSIDVNTHINSAHLKNEISEYESVLERLTRFGNEKGISDNPKYSLVFEEYKGNVPSLIELSSIINENNMPLFDVYSSKNIGKIKTSIIDSKATKFSEMLMGN